MILSAAGVMEACVTRMPVWNLCWLTCWAKARICFMPMLGSEANSIQMVPIWGSGLGSAFVGMAVYFASMASVGLKEVFIFFRLGGGVSSVGTLAQGAICGAGGQTQAHRWGQRSLCENRRGKS